MKRLLFIALLVVFGCDELTNNNNEDEVEVVFNLEPRLDQDENGYYHLELNPTTFKQYTDYPVISTGIDNRQMW